jgi:hypothetical protein
MTLLDSSENLYDNTKNNEEDYSNNNILDEEDTNSVQVPSDLIDDGFIRVGQLLTSVQPHDYLVMTHPRSEKVSIEDAKNVAKQRTADMVAYKTADGTAFTGTLDSKWISDDLCECEKHNKPSACVMSKKMVTENKKNNSAYTLFINTDNKNYKKIVKQKLQQCVDKISKQQKNIEHKMGYAKYKKANLNMDNPINYKEYLNQKKNQEQMKVINDAADSNSDKIAAINTALSSNMNTLNVLHQMGQNKQELLNKNSYDINSIDEKILTTSEKINNLRDKYNFNNKIIKLLRTITLWIFIITMFILCYYGVRDKYVDKIKPKTGKNLK